MVRNYIKTAFRNLLKNKSASAINILGLMIGFCSCLLMGIYIIHELTYDNFEVKGDRIVRVDMGYRFSGGGDEKKTSVTSVRVAPVFKNTFPEIVDAVRMAEYKRIVKFGDKTLDESRFMYADPSFFKIFSFNLIKGNSQQALNAPNTVILTASTAKKYFGEEDPLNKTIMVGTDKQLYAVTGVMPDCPSNSQIKFDFLASFSTLKLISQEQSYWDANYITFFLLKAPSEIGTLQAKIGPFMKKEMAGAGASVNFYLEPFQSIHLHSDFDGFEPNNNIRYIYVLEAATLLVLLIACFTYVNLNTARSLERAREVGVRKVIGAEKSQLFWQFIGESLFLSTLAMLLSVAAAILLLPTFNTLTGADLPFSSIISPVILLGATAVIIMVSLLAGSYPALVLAGFQPVKVLKGSFKNTGSGQALRKSLTVFQFSISVMLIVSTVIMQKQLSYIQHKNVGYNRNQVVVLPMDEKMAEKIKLIKQQFKENASIKDVSACHSTPINIVGGYSMRSSQMPDNQQIAVTADPVDEDFIKTTGLQIIAGTDLIEQDIKDVADTDYRKNTFHFILNEAAAKELGWSPEEAIGKKMFLDNTRSGYVKAVVKNFNFESLHHEIKPVVLFPDNGGNRLMVKLQGNNIPAAIGYLESAWKELVPYRPFEYHFMDEDFDKLYAADLRLGQVLNVFSAIAIALACLGLIGLSAYSAKQRTKEIGIRKVMGASVANVTALLTADFLKLVIIAILIASPLAWLAMNKWLSDFAYRITVSWWLVALTSIGVMAVALLSVSYQTIKAALLNPIKSLKSE
jgi:putative ABC transport system permease protein